jgi:hypothetical protein
VSISCFDDLLAAARAQPLAQRVLLVFVQTKMQKDYDAVERAGFERGEGGALQPMFCVDFSVAELTDFAALARDADQLDQPWDKVLVACMDDVGDAPTRADTELRLLVGRIEAGEDLRSYACFDSDGDAVRFSAPRHQN